LHEKLVFNRRAEVLSNWYARLIPRDVRVLDVGCGDGLISALLHSKRPDIEVHGIDVLPRDRTRIGVEVFDGVHIPFENGTFDVVLFSDVLHHTNNPMTLQREARRVASQCVIIKDHYRQGFAATARLRFMDWVGNARFGVALAYNYRAERQWRAAWQEIGLQPESLVTRLGLYPGPVDWVFGAQLHFIALLNKCDPAAGSASIGRQA
jgi:SAM-dependent methyltransferase